MLALFTLTILADCCFPAFSLSRSPRALGCTPCSSWVEADRHALTSPLLLPPSTPVRRPRHSLGYRSWMARGACLYRRARSEVGRGGADSRKAAAGGQEGQEERRGVLQVWVVECLTPRDRGANPHLLVQTERMERDSTTGSEVLPRVESRDDCATTYSRFESFRTQSDGKLSEVDTYRAQASRAPKSSQVGAVRASASLPPILRLIFTSSARRPLEWTTTNRTHLYLLPQSLHLSPPLQPATANRPLKLSQQSVLLRRRSDAPKVTGGGKRRLRFTMSFQQRTGRVRSIGKRSLASWLVAARWIQPP